MSSFNCLLLVTFFTFQLNAQTADSLVQVYTSDTLIEYINYSLPRICTNQKKEIRKDPSYYNGPVITDGVYESTRTIFIPIYVKPIKVKYSNRLGDIYKMIEFCGINFNEKTTYFYANGLKKKEKIAIEDCTIYKTYLLDGSLNRFDMDCYDDEDGYVAESKTAEYYSLKTEDSTLMIHYFRNGNIKSREVSKAEKEHIDYWDENAYYLGAHFYLEKDSFKIRHDISIEGDTTIPEGWMELNPITLQEEYHRNE